MNERKKSFIPWSLLFLSLAAGPAISAVDTQFQGGVQTAYDDNINSDKSGRKGDLVTDLLLGASILKEEETYKIRIGGSIEEQIYARYSSFTNNAQNLEVAIEKDLSKRDHLRFQNKLRHAKEPHDFESAFGRESGFYSFFRNRAEVFYRRDFSKSLTAELGYGNQIYEVSRSDLKDSLQNRFQVEVDYDQSRATRFLTYYERTMNSFDPGGSVATDHFGGGLRQYITKQISLETRLGVTMAHSINGKDFAKPSLKVTLRDEFSDTTTFNLAFTKNVLPLDYSEDVFDMWQIAGSMEQKLLRRLSGELSAFYGRGTFIDTRVKDSLAGVKIKTSYEIRENVDAFLSYTFSRTDSNDSSRDYWRNVFALGVGFAF